MRTAFWVVPLLLALIPQNQPPQTNDSDRMSFAGQILLPSGQPAVGLKVSLLRDLVRVSTVAVTKTDDLGRYSFNASGDYYSFEIIVTLSSGRDLSVWSPGDRHFTKKPSSSDINVPSFQMPRNVKSTCAEKPQDEKCRFVFLARHGTNNSPQNLSAAFSGEISSVKIAFDLNGQGSDAEESQPFFATLYHYDRLDFGKGYEPIPLASLSWQDWTNLSENADHLVAQDGAKTRRLSLRDTLNRLRHEGSLFPLFLILLLGFLVSKVTDRVAFFLPFLLIVLSVIWWRTTVWQNTATGSERISITSFDSRILHYVHTEVDRLINEESSAETKRDDRILALGLKGEDEGEFVTVEEVSNAISDFAIAARGSVQPK